MTLREIWHAIVDTRIPFGGLAEWLFTIVGYCLVVFIPLVAGWGLYVFVSGFIKGLKGDQQSGRSDADAKKKEAK